MDIEDDSKEFCFECMTPRDFEKNPLQESKQISKSNDSKKKLNDMNYENNNLFFTSLENTNMETQNNTLNYIFGTITTGLLLIIVAFLAWNTLTSKSIKYEYKVLSVQAQFSSKTEESTGLNELNNSKLGATSVNLKDEELNILGSENWELVATFLEIETTHPNYGNGAYVTGLQPNIRPQKVVMIFKRPLQ